MTSGNLNLQQRIEAMIAWHYLSGLSVLGDRALLLFDILGELPLEHPHRTECIQLFLECCTFKQALFLFLKHCDGELLSIVRQVMINKGTLRDFERLNRGASYLHGKNNENTVLACLEDFSRSVISDHGHPLDCTN